MIPLKISNKQCLHENCTFEKINDHKQNILHENSDNWKLFVKDKKC